MLLSVQNLHPKQQQLGVTPAVFRVRLSPRAQQKLRVVKNKKSFAVLLHAMPTNVRPETASLFSFAARAGWFLPRHVDLGREGYLLDVSRVDGWSAADPGVCDRPLRLLRQVQRSKKVQPHRLLAFQVNDLSGLLL